MAERKHQFWFESENLIVPINIDVNFFGARYMDSFCWSSCSDYASVDEFAWQTCQDMDLPSGFRHRIAIQIIEQLDSYKDVILSAKYCIACDDNKIFQEKFKIPLTIDLCLRKDVVEYIDRFTWDLSQLTSSLPSTIPATAAIMITPESFAHTTVLDLGLPIEMEPMITYKIREALFRHLIQCVQEEVISDHNTTSSDIINNTSTSTTINADNKNETITKIDSESSITNRITPLIATTTATTPLTVDNELSEYPKVRLCSQSSFFNAVTETYKKLIPGPVADVTTVSHARMPENKITNAYVWKQ